MNSLDERTLIEMNRIRNIICVALITLSGMTLAAEEQAPRAVVERLHETLLEAMTRAEQLGYEGRFDLISPVIEDSFDFNTIARIVTGRYWKDTNLAQRDVARILTRTGGPELSVRDNRLFFKQRTKNLDGPSSTTEHLAGRYDQTPTR